jgi:hypothetical protein
MAIQWISLHGFVVLESSSAGLEWIGLSGSVVKEQDVVVGGGFQAAWARGANTIIQNGRVGA